MATNKAYDILGLALRAGKLATGDEGVLKSVRSGQAKLVVVASDASDNAVKKYTDKCTFYHVPIVRYGDRTSLGASIGKETRVVVALTDAGFARLFREAAQNLEEVRNIE